MTTEKPTKSKRFLAFFSAICPFCVCARKFPDSHYAKTLRKIETHCPACKAYDELHTKQ